MNPKISNYTGNTFVFNADAIKQFKIREFKYCQLTFDKVRKNIRLRLFKEQVEGTTKLCPDRSSMILRCGAFLTKYNLPKKFSVELTQDHVSGVLLAQVPEVKEKQPTVTTPKPTVKPLPQVILQEAIAEMVRVEAKKLIKEFFVDVLKRMDES